MPFVSKAQEKFAFSTHQPWAKEWASKTDQKELPEHVKKMAAIKKASESLKK